MMSSAHAVSSVHSSKKSIGLVGLLLLSTLGGIALSPTASANVSGDYEITTHNIPMEDAHESSWDPVDVEVTSLTLDSITTHKHETSNGSFVKGHKLKTIASIKEKTMARIQFNQFRLAPIQFSQ